MKKYLLILILNFQFSILNSLSAQSTQTIRGKLIDKETQAGLFGGSVVVADDSTHILGAQTDVDGNFAIRRVPLGKHALQVRCIGYDAAILSNIIVTAGKEVVLNIQLEQKVLELKIANVAATRQGEANNEMSTVSARSFTVEEVQRFAGSRQDPARMASNFAGVQGADDSRNDIVIRGNSPSGLLYKIEGVDVINPNHFAVPGSTGSALSLLNDKVLANSDFFTGAFPAEYGNAIAGIFDIRFRNGNNEKHEYTAQFGFLGTELMAEGPFSKKSGSSYLIAYRYSTLKLFDAMNIKIGTDAIPQYQDLSFKLNFPAKKAGTFSLFGIGGTSKIDILVSDKTEPTDEIYGDKDRDQHFSTSTGVAGIVHTYQWNKNVYSKIVLAGSVAEANAHHDLVFRDSTFKVDSLVSKLNYKFIDSRISLNAFINARINPKNIFKIGITADELFFNYQDSNYLENQYAWDVREDAKDNALLLQPFIEFKHKLNDAVTLNAGVHGQIFTINKNSSAMEGRLGAQWKVNENQKLSLGLGMHCQQVPSYIYFAQQKNYKGEYERVNHDLGFMQSNHIVLGYDLFIKNNARLKLETYYQHLNNIPVEIETSSVSLLNQGASFNRYFPEAMINEGMGENYGVEFTVEKYFSSSYYAMITTTLYDSKYKGSDGMERNTDFNGNYILNILAGKETSLNKKKTTVLTTAAKITTSGGTLYTPADTAASNVEGELVVVDSLRNSKQFHNYFRADIKIGLRFNGKKVSHTIAVDLVNILNTQNILGLTYVPVAANSTKPALREEYQLGFLPLFYYKIDF